MAASKQTIKQMIQVMRKHVPTPKLQALARDLLLVKGNKSFEATIKLLHRGLKSP